MEEMRDIEMIVDDAASNVACEAGNLSDAVKDVIKEHLAGYSGKTDESFIYGLVKRIDKGEKNDRRTK